MRELWLILPDKLLAIVALVSSLSLTTLLMLLLTVVVFSTCMLHSSVERSPEVCHKY